MTTQCKRDQYYLSSVSEGEIERQATSERVQKHTKIRRLQTNRRRKPGKDPDRPKT